MAKLPWILVAGVMTVAAAPMGCFFVGNDGGPPNEGSGTYGIGGGGGGTSSGGGDQCNPVTAAGCPSDGSTCDLNSTNNVDTFTCFNGPNTQDVCSPCDALNGPFCGAGLTCVVGGETSVGTCYRYCCADEDCGEGGSCDLSLGQAALKPGLPADKVGLCIQAGTNAATPACGPAAPLSGGSCVGGYNSSGASTGSVSSSSSGGWSRDGGSFASSSSGSSGAPGDGGSFGTSSSSSSGAPSDGGSFGTSSSGAPGDGGSFGTSSSSSSGAAGDGGSFGTSSSSSSGAAGDGGSFGTSSSSSGGGEGGGAPEADGGSSGSGTGGDSAGRP